MTSTSLAQTRLIIANDEPAKSNLFFNNTFIVGRTTIPSPLPDWIKREMDLSAQRYNIVIPYNPEDDDAGNDTQQQQRPVSPSYAPHEYDPASPCLSSSSSDNEEIV